MGRKMMEDKRYPIYPAEIEKYRRELKIGQQVKVKVQKKDLDSRTRTVQKTCIVEEKHKWLFLARDRKGGRYAVTYVDMILKGGA